MINIFLKATVGEVYLQQKLSDASPFAPKASLWLLLNLEIIKYNLRGSLFGAL